MAKSRLKTQEIRDMQKGGRLQRDIACEAGMSQTAVHFRLRPDRRRRKMREKYRSLGRQAKKEYLEGEKKRKQRLQAITEKVATKRGVPWGEDEIEYLRENGPVETTFQLALALERTFHAVQYAAKSHGISLRNE